MHDRICNRVNAASIHLNEIHNSIIENCPLPTQLHPHNIVFSARVF